MPIFVHQFLSMKNLLLLMGCALLMLNTMAQTSFQVQPGVSNRTMDVKGRVIDATTNEPVVGANVVIKGTTKGAPSDFDGYFTLPSVPEGSLTLMVSYVSYKGFETTIQVAADANIFLEIALEQNVELIQTVTVIGKQITDTEISMMKTIRDQNTVTNGVPAQMIKKTQDRDAGEVVSRIPGITIQDGRFVVIRGLNERYNSVWLNDLPAPGAEADAKAFSFDFVPASMIDNIVVYKSFSPELPGDFAGGLVQISTICNPETNFVQASYSSAVSEGSSFQQHKLYPVGGSGFSNSISGLTLPGAFPEQLSAISSTELGKDEKTFWGQSLNKLWTPQNIVAPADQRLSLGGAWKKDIGKVRIANYSQVNYSATFQQDSIFRAAYNSYDEIAQKPDTSYCFNDVQYSNSAKIGAMSNWSVSKGKSRIEFRNIFNYQASNRVTEREGHDFYGGLDLRGLNMTVKVRRLYSGQLSGVHTFGKHESKLKWYAGYSATSQQMPDSKRLTWVRNDQEDSPEYGQYGLNFSFTANSNLSGRIFHDMHEQIFNAGSDVSSSVSVGSIKMEYKTGFFAEARNRSFYARNLGYKIAKTSQFDWSLPYENVGSVFSNENINTTDGIMLDEQTNPSDSYTSDSKLLAGYFSLLVPAGTRIKIHTGLRAEFSQVRLNSYKTDATNPPAADDEVHYASDALLWLPAFNLTYMLSENTQLRLAYGQTVNRPEYREIAPMAFYDYELKAVISGNDSLTFASIHNFDARYEWYPSAFSMFSLGAFHKQFINAIEYQIIPTGSGLQYTFQNTPKAQVSGIEAEVRLSAPQQSEKTFLRNLTLVFNAALMNSNIQFENNSLEDNRPLQGQSPYILNTALFYQNDSLNFNAAIMYNVAGKRISFVGDPYTGNPHVYEMPVNRVDVSFGKRIGKSIEIKAQIRNLLKNNVTFCQEVETSEGTVTQTTLQYRSSRSYLIGLVWKF